MTSWLKRAGTWAAARLENETVFAGVVTGLFLALGVVGVLHHEMWRDEMHAWLVARDSSSPWAIFQVTRYEAHFALWRVILFPLTRCTHNPVAMQFLNLLVASGTVWIVARCSPFRRWEKVLFSFGYFPLYEYCIIAQDYTLIVVLLFACCALYGRRTRSYVGLSVALFLMANTLPYGLVIALVFAALLVFDWLFNQEACRRRVVSRRNLCASAVIVLVGIGCAVLQLALMKESPSTTWRSSLSFTHLARAVTNISRAYIPIPKGFPIWTTVAWGSNFLDAIRSAMEIGTTQSLILFMISVGLLARRPPALFLYVLGIASLLWVQFVVSIGASRHAGFLFLLFIASLWIWRESEEWELSVHPMGRFGDVLGRWRNHFLVGLLLIHLIAGVDSFSADLALPFSASKQAARFLRDRGLSDRLLIGSKEMQVSALAGYLDKKIFYPGSSRFGSYIDYSQPIQPVSPQQVLKAAWDFVQRSRQDVVIVVSDPIGAVGGNGATTPLHTGRVHADGTTTPLSNDYVSPSARIQFLKFFGSVLDEHYFVYLMEPD